MDLLVALGIIRERINKELQKKLKQNSIDISCGHIWLLSVVYSNNGRSEIKELVKQLEKKKSTVTEMINTLEKNGYLVKYQSKEDKRVYYVETTDRAEEMKDHILTIVENIKKKMFLSFSDGDKDILGELMMKIIGDLK
ncbi:MULTISPECIES: MarR family winged helix-turn-helix transcriptional regulator [Psychrilyobacter]|uniref:MarR family transcriptional regulator n=1 Tax=Psychrilyobacter piezotolerans TaxID=2293438 RepID=A0ABX9KF76_9FUSO|nr:MULTISPECIES: MarR family transcriptional regulator [Psychrilyobacter]MCS5422569.1 MarR family transcriptional regulator [Psychrilyobacter sp. S5]NDI78689.1 MarR family transcriptional regulator [Psychrilyobacter piezotolerans]RDE59866.1 MarR family transcriptional regulator [Psychrilyobacter sp. S5]REI40147.1 MarR family transcriptional regulator [Psychrilyobacter piezotolerans]